MIFIKKSEVHDGKWRSVANNKINETYENMKHSVTQCKHTNIVTKIINTTD